MLLACYIQLSIPFIILPGVAYAILYLVFAARLVGTKLTAPALVLLGIHAYLLTVTLVASGQISEVREVNSGLMMQIAMGLGALVVLEIGGLKEILRLATVICAVALAGVFSELLGLDVQSVLPSKYHEAPPVLYQEGPVFYASTETRWRGVYAEASVLGAVTAGFVVVMLVSCAFIGGRRPLTVRFCVALSALCAMLIIGIALTKAGILIFAIGFIIALAAAMVSRDVNALRGLCAIGAPAVVGLFVALLFLPDSMREYLYSEFASAEMLLGGGNEKDVAGKGVFSRSAGWQIAFASLLERPLGTSMNHVVDIATNNDVYLGDELTFCFTHGIYGLKSALANLLVTGGFIGLMLLFCFLFVLHRLIVTRYPIVSTALPKLFLVSTCVCICFLCVVENRYLVWAFMIIATTLPVALLQVTESAYTTERR